LRKKLIRIIAITIIVMKTKKHQLHSRKGVPLGYREKALQVSLCHASLDVGLLVLAIELQEEAMRDDPVRWTAELIPLTSIEEGTTQTEEC